MICVPLTGPTMEAMLTDAGRAEALGADMVEFRLDTMDAPQVDELVARSPLPAIFTCRPVREGGRFDGDEALRIRILQEAVDLGADCVDVELDSVDKIRRRPTVSTIVSVHDFERTPEDLDAIVARVEATNPDVVKIAVTATDIADNLRIFDVLKRATLPTIALAMGERGVISRILAPKFGGYLTYAALEKGAGSAPGQLAVDELLTLYRYREIGPDTKLFGVIANPVAHSMSPAIHNAAFAERGVNAVYLPLLVDDVSDFLARFRGMFDGFSITIPHKEAAMRSADEIDDITRRIGALNTLVKRRGRLIGTNTDCAAAIGAIEDAMGGRKGGRSPLAGKSVALIGAGGTTRALGAGFVDAGAALTLYNRTESKAHALAEALGCAWAPLAALSGARPDVIANTTSVGMHPHVDANVVPEALLAPGVVVFDAVYNPLVTRLLAAASKRGATAVSGLEMFVRQAAEQFRLFTGKTPPVDTMRRVVEAHLTAR